MKTKAIQTNTIDKDIEKGVFKNHYLIYNRKSTDEPENQKNSLHYQRAENIQFAKKERLSIAPVSIDGFCVDGIIGEKHSAFKENETMIIADDGMVQFKVERPKFHKMMQLLNRKLFKGVIFLCWDRASRNDADEAILKKLLKSDVDLRFTLVSYDKTSSGALHMDIDGMFAQHHSRVTSEKVKLNIRNQREKGICTSKAPVGYLNLGRMDNKPFDPERAPIVQQLFQKYAKGDYSLAQLTEWAIGQGFRMYPMRRRRTKAERQQEEESDAITEINPVARIPSRTSMHKILCNPFYIGKIMGNEGEYIHSNSHEALVTEELFTSVQNLLNNKNRKIQYTSVLFYPYRGLIRCEECSRVYTPYIKKGIQYYCVNCKPTCTNTIKNFNNSLIDKKISETIEKLVLTDEELKAIEEVTTNELPKIEQKRLDNVAQLDRQKRKLQEDVNYLQQNKLDLLKTGIYTPQAYIVEEQKIHEQIRQLNEQEQEQKGSLFEAVENIKKLSELLKNLSIYDFAAKPTEKDEITRLVFSELYLFENTFKYKCKNEFQVLDKRFVPYCALKDWIYELPCLTKEVKLYCNDPPD